MNEITTNSNAAEVIDFTAKAKEYLTSQGSKLPQKHLTQFLELAQAFQLNPFKREIYAVGYGDNWNIITGFEVYLKRAERSGLLDGWETEETGNVNDGTLKSTITIYRKDRSKPFRHTVYYSEAVNKTKDKTTGQEKPNSVWAKMPHYMTKKVAMAQGFRLCFPDELSGMPYTADEISPIEMPTEKNITSAATAEIKPKAEQKNDPFRMNDAQAKMMRDMFADTTFTDDEKNNFRSQLMNHAMTAEKLLETVTTIYNERKMTPPTVEAAAAVFDGEIVKPEQEAIF